MILVLLIAIPAAAGLLVWLVGRWSRAAARIVSLSAMAVDFVLVIVIWLYNYYGPNCGGQSWMLDFYLPWIPQFGIGFHLAVDGLSLVMAGLTAFIGMASVICSWTEIQERAGFFHFNLLWNLAGIMGVFLAVDLFLFYFFWELMLVPMYLLIGIWGHENRGYAAMKFFIFTQASGLFMLIAILGLYFINARTMGIYTFDYMNLLHAALTPGEARLLAAGFLVAFLVKLPAVPFHNWLPDAHTEAPTGGSVILAGLLLKTGAYGILRFVIPLFPLASMDFRYIAMSLGVVGILYGAKLAFAQTDLKRLVAYTSVSHMGFVMVGAFAANELSLQGVVMEIVCHAVSTGALFILAGALQERLHTRELGQMGGFWRIAPRMGGVMLFFALASVALPGLGNFVAEFLILAGAYRASPAISVLSSLGLIFSSVYGLWTIQAVFHGGVRPGVKLADLSMREMSLMGVMIVVMLWLGLFPQPLFNTVRAALDAIRGQVVSTQVRSASLPRTDRLPHFTRLHPPNPPEGGLRLPENQPIDLLWRQ
jgi:NADH-quinone oxidoreductase subunit M